jgi:hypothetical protein
MDIQWLNIANLRNFYKFIHNLNKTILLIKFRQEFPILHFPKQEQSFPKIDNSRALRFWRFVLKLLVYNFDFLTESNSLRDFFKRLLQLATIFHQSWKCFWIHQIRYVFYFLLQVSLFQISIFILITSDVLVRWAIFGTFSIKLATIIILKSLFFLKLTTGFL